MSKSELEQEFLKYVEIGRDLPKQAPDVMLIAYGLYKQAIAGDNSETRPTENSDVVRTFMYDQWKRLEGMSTDEAMKKYIEFIKNLESQINASQAAKLNK